MGKGAFSAKYGNTLGGTINLIPAVPGDDPEMSIFTGYKRYNTFSAGATAAGRSGDFAALLSAGYNETDGHLRNSGAERIDVGGRFYWFWGDDGEISSSFRRITSYNVCYTKLLRLVRGWFKKR